MLTRVRYEEVAGPALSTLLGAGLAGVSLLVVDHELNVIRSLGERTVSQAAELSSSLDVLGWLRRALEGERSGPFTLADPRRGGELSFEFLPVAGEHGAVVAAMTLVRQTPAVPLGGASLRYLANHDPLTGLRNRHAFLEAVGQHAAHCVRYGSQGSVLLLDLDRFRVVNDHLGEAAGDALLIGVGDRLRERLRRTDVIARMGADEYGIMLPVGGHEECEAVAGALVESIRHLQFPPLHLAASVGAVVIGECAELTGEGLLHAADFALFRAKSAGGDRFERYQPPPER